MVIRPSSPLACTSGKCNTIADDGDLMIHRQSLRCLFAREMGGEEAKVKKIAQNAVLDYYVWTSMSLHQHENSPRHSRSTPLTPPPPSHRRKSQGHPTTHTHRPTLFLTSRSVAGPPVSTEPEAPYTVTIPLQWGGIVGGGGGGGGGVCWSSSWYSVARSFQCCISCSNTGTEM